MLNKFIDKHITENLQWFFDKHLKDHYSRRREHLEAAGKKHELQYHLMPVIDYILKTCISPDSHYPPDSIEHWKELYTKLGVGYSNVFQHLLMIYLKLDLSSYLSVRERESTTGRQTRTKDKSELTFLQTTLDELMNVSLNFDFKVSTVKLSTGLWAIDNEQFNLMLTCLSNPSVNLINYFESSRDVVQQIVGTLHVSDKNRIALYMCRIHRPENWDEDYDNLYAYLLIHSGRLVEALKYERLFNDHENYIEILQQFIELCSKLNVTKALNRLYLDAQEEAVWNRHLDQDSRPVTPADNMSQTKYQSQQQPKQNHDHHPQQHQQQKVTLNTSVHLNISNHSHNHSTSSSTNTFKTPQKPALKNDYRNSSRQPTPRNRAVQMLRRVPSFSDSPARNTRSARKKKSAN